MTNEYTPIISELTDEVESFLVDNPEISATRLGVLACNDAHAVRRIREGLGITDRRIDQLRQFMTKYEADGVAA